MIDHHLLIQEDMKTRLLYLQTKIDVLQIHKVPLIEQAHPTENFSFDQDTGEGDKFGFFHRFVFWQYLPAFLSASLFLSMPQT